MSDESMEIADNASNGFSRRNALKAGVAAGVGVAAWSGATITSLGGTPAYAVGCTGAVIIDLLDPSCRNTDNASGCMFGYHTLKSGLPTGYGIVNNIPEGTACCDDHVSQFTFPSGMTCQVVLQFNGPSCAGPSRGTLTFGPESDGSLDITFSCLPVDPGSNAFYSAKATCFTTGTPPSCFQ
jgi:hypothetical protein